MLVGRSSLVDACWLMVVQADVLCMGFDDEPTARNPSTTARQSTESLFLTVVARSCRGRGNPDRPRMDDGIATGLAPPAPRNDTSCIHEQAPTGRLTTRRTRRLTTRRFRGCGDAQEVDLSTGCEEIRWFARPRGRFATPGRRFATDGRRGDTTQTRAAVGRTLPHPCSPYDASPRPAALRRRRSPVLRRRARRVGADHPAARHAPGHRTSRAPRWRTPCR